MSYNISNGDPKFLKMIIVASGNDMANLAHSHTVTFFEPRFLGG